MSLTPCASKRFMAFLVATGLAACSTGPAHVRPAVALPAQFEVTLASADWQVRNPQGFTSSEAVWAVFEDAQLTRLQTAAGQGSQTLKAVEARYRSAQAALQISEAVRLPQLDSRLKMNQNHDTGSSSSASLSMGVSWEVDLWGRIGRVVEGATAITEAGAYDLAAARLSLQALVAQMYFQWRANEAEGLLWQRILESDRRLLTLTRERHAAGVVSGLDVSQAETQLANAEAQAAENALLVRQARYALATLVGDPALTLPAGLPLPKVLAAPALIPSLLVEWRPDIQAAERRVAAANAAIGQAKTAFFPTLNVSADAGLRGSHLARIASQPIHFWSLGPSLALTVFDADARRAGVSRAEAEHEVVVAEYRQAVLAAFQEVQDNLVAAHGLANQAVHQELALVAARRANTLAMAQYQAGTISGLNVLTTQRAEQMAEIQSLRVWGRRMATSVQLLKNVGGGI